MNPSDTPNQSNDELPVPITTSAGSNIANPQQSPIIQTQNTQSVVQQQPNNSPQGAVAPVSTPADADDTDLIEKEWVVKAKDIVDKTRNDPYTQSQEINKVKADYIKKRFNKDIKLGDE